MKLLWSLFSTFFRIGLFTFGGGYAMLPMLQREVVDKHGWADEPEVLDFYAVAQCTPGIIAVNTATFIGYKKAKTPGAIIATAGICAPSLLIIVIIAAFIQNFLQYEVVGHAMAGVQVAVAALIINVAVGMWKKGVKDVLTFILFILAAVAALVFAVSPILIVVAAAVTGIVSERIKKTRAG